MTFSGSVCSTSLFPELRTGVEFSDYRRYVSGDDPRSLDWNAYLRLGKLFLKTYRLEERISVRILLDCSESMNFGRGRESKFSYARHLAAAFSYLALLHLDSVAIAPFAMRLSKSLVASGGRDGFWPVMKFRNSLPCGGGKQISGYSGQSSFWGSSRRRERCWRFRISSTRRGARERWKCSGWPGTILCSCRSTARKNNAPQALAN